MTARRSPSPGPDAPDADRTQHEALARAERDAAADRPADYQEEATSEKIVSTRRDGQHEAGDISGIDNDRATRGRAADDS
ncbi:MAG: hypothetical protein AB7P21_18050 [Lautropia sp.]